MIRCPNCGTMNNSKAKFCGKCGHPLPSQNIKSKANNNTIRCPNCGKLNQAGVKFCMYCGFPLNRDTNQQPSQFRPQQQYQPRPNPQWQQANQAVNQASNYFSDYFKWLEQTLVDPSAKISDSKYFGITSFIIISALLCFAGIVTNKLDRPYSSALPLIPMSNSFKQITAVPMYLITAFLFTILSIFAYWIISYFGSNIATHQRQNIFDISNQLASVTNIDIFIPMLIMLSAFIQIPTLTWILIMTFNIIFIVGIFNVVIPSKAMHSKISSVYIAIASDIASVIATVLIAYIIGLVLVG